jgi:hypothetical protein
MASIWPSHVDNTGCGKITSFFEYEMPYENGSYLAALCIITALGLHAVIIEGAAI